ncbi:MAG: glutamate-5-semialdehyde dehydrogenase [Planctomycetes bacterium]|nr:glutamate-5-semialdehyde dehydrogenase [Planctomycetota bacterium]
MPASRPRNLALAYVRSVVRRARHAARGLATLDSGRKDRALLQMAQALHQAVPELMSENRKDVQAGQAAGLPAALLDRLTLNEKRIAAMASGLEQIAALPDPVGRVLDGWSRPNGLQIQQVRVPIGVIAIVYESRPNVTADAAGLCLKSGNASILRGGKEALRSNLAIHGLLARCLKECGLSPHAIQMIDRTDRSVVKHLARSDGWVNLIIPRGGEGLIRAVAEEATVPVMKHYKGVCHVYVDRDADLDMARSITVNAKVQRPGVCNAAECLLVHRDVARAFLPSAAAELRAAHVELRACPETRCIVRGLIPAQASDWGREFLDLILAVRVVHSLQEAIDFINTYGSGHSDAIVTRNLTAAAEFTRQVDSAAVFVNASTRFTDGYEFGMGAEIGISTDRLHARGPVGLRELTTYKYIVHGTGQIRQ